MTLKYQRIMLKVSGEALMGSLSFGHDPETINKITDDIAQVYHQGKEICLVVGGGNIFRGKSAADIGIERSTADYMGMLATVMNAIALQSSLEKKNIITRVQSSISMTSLCEPYIPRRAKRHLEKGRVVIFAAGLGSPFFTTDSAAVLRAIEMGCDAIFKGTKVAGVFSEDPFKNPDAVHYAKLNYKEVIQEDIKVMDASAITLAMDNNLPIIVFSLKDKLQQILEENGQFTIIQ